MHVVVKNLQSIRGESRWGDFIAELNTCNFDVLLICETWRGERDESVITEKGHHVYLSGGATHQGVEICISANFASRISHISFHAYSKKICNLHFSMASRRFRVFSVYFPTGTSLASFQSMDKSSFTKAMGISFPLSRTMTLNSL